MMLENEEEAPPLPMQIHSQPEVLCSPENDYSAKKIVRKVADEFLNLSIKIGSREQLDKYVEDYETFNGKGQPSLLIVFREEFYNLND